MRITRWNSKELFQGLIDKAERGANVAMDDVVVGAKLNFIAGRKQWPPIVRQGKFGKAHVQFSPKRGKHKGLIVDFLTDKRWTGRQTPDNLLDSIRRVNRAGSGKVRVYAGNFKVYWAFMIEKSGYTDRSGKKHKPLHFMKKAFHVKKKNMVKQIASGGA